MSNSSVSEQFWTLNFLNNLVSEHFFSCRHEQLLTYVNFRPSSIYHWSSIIKSSTPLHHLPVVVYSSAIHFLSAVSFVPLFLLIYPSISAVFTWMAMTVSSEIKSAFSHRSSCPIIFISENTFSDSWKNFNAPLTEIPPINDVFKCIISQIPILKQPVYACIISKATCLKMYYFQSNPPKNVLFCKQPV